MTGLESTLIGFGSLAVAGFGTYLTTARYYHGRFDNMIELFVTLKECKNCRELCAKDTKARDTAVDKMVTTIESLASKYDRILKILILKSDLPDELKQQILP